MDTMTIAAIVAVGAILALAFFYRRRLVGTSEGADIQRLLRVATQALILADATRELWEDALVDKRPVNRALEALEWGVALYDLDVSENDLIDIIAEAARELGIEWIDEEIISWASERAFGQVTTLPDDNPPQAEYGVE